MSGAFTAAAVASLVGAGVNSYAQNQNMRKEDNQTAQSIINQSQINAKAEKAVGDLNSSIAKSNPAQAQTQQNAAYVKALQDANLVQGTSIPGVSGASKRYNQAATAARSDVNNYARQTASNLAATAAPQLQRIGEGNQIANTASDLGLLNDQSSAEQALLKTRLAEDQANPWLTSVATLLQGAGQGYASYAGGRKPPANPYLGGSYG